MILCIETATSVCSVALCSTDSIVSERESLENKSHATLLTTFIREMLNEQGIRASDLEAVAVSKGPGSYTGLRIGVSAAKGISYAASVPLIGIDTPQAMYYGMKQIATEKYGLSENDFLCPMIDAKRMEVYYCLYSLSGIFKASIKAGIITEDSFSDIPDRDRILFFGDGAGKCESVLNRKNMLFDSRFDVSASHLRIPAREAFKSNRFEDVAYFEPFYLKDFIATIPKKSVIGK